MKQLLALLTIVSIFALTSTTTSSCTKTTTTHDSTTVIVRDTVYQHLKNPIVGLWVGTFKYIGGNPADSFYQSYTINGNGTLITTDINLNENSSSAVGPWQLNGTTFTANIVPQDATNTVQTVTATYDSVAGTLSGQVLYTQGTGSNTTILLFRVQ